MISFISPLPNAMASPTPRRQTFVNSIATPRCNRGVFGGFNHSQAPQMPSQQHLGVEHMISPRTPQVNAFSVHSSKSSIESERRNTDNSSTCSPIVNSNPEDHRRFSRSIRLLQRNKVDPAKSTKSSHRLSMPTPQTTIDDTTKPIHYTHFSINKKQSVAHIGTFTNNEPTAIHIHGILAQTSFNEHNSVSGSMSPYITSPRLSSWIPGLFYFKQPKVSACGCGYGGDGEVYGSHLMPFLTNRYAP